MLRITRIIASNGLETLKLEGRVAGAPVRELERVARELLAQSRRLALDLSGVTFVDAEGAALLRELLDRQAIVLRSSGLVTELLREVDR